MIKTIEIDKDIYDSLRGFYFNDYSDAYKAACYRAYRDFQRTIKFKIIISKLSNQSEKKAEENKRTVLKDSIVELLRTKIGKLHSIIDINQDEFDKWHKIFCEEIIDKYAEKSIILADGQVQKWINMSIKYLYCLGEDNFIKEFRLLHIPVDNYIIDIAYKKLKIEKPQNAWSTWNYDNYSNYQKQLRELIDGEDPLRWEFHNWLTSARNFNDIENMH